VLWAAGYFPISALHNVQYDSVLSHTHSLLSPNQNSSFRNKNPATALTNIFLAFKMCAA